MAYSEKDLKWGNVLWFILTVGPSNVCRGKKGDDQVISFSKSLKVKKKNRETDAYMKVYKRVDSITV